MQKVIVIGCGLLGRRHLESLAALTTPVEIWGVDPSVDALTLAAKVFFETDKQACHKLNLSKTFNNLPRYVDVVISATNSTSRLDSLVTLYDKVEAKYLILEKVLFSKLADFDFADKLFKEKHQGIWVNCPRRANVTYQAIKNRIRNGQKVDMAVFGGNWGLASNSIHFIDLFAFLTGGALLNVDTSDLDDVIYQSKREGFTELSGTINCTFDEGNLMLASDIDRPLEVKIEITIDDLVIKLNELERTVTVIGERQSMVSDGSIELELQSRLTTSYVADLLSGSELSLARYDESAALHKPFIRACIEHQRRVFGREVLDCKIT